MQAVYTDILRESSLRLKLLPGTRYFDITGALVKELPIEAGNKFFCMCSAQLYKVNGLAGLSLRLHAIQPFSEEEPPKKKQRT
jgi:hypothetical protein